MRAAFEHAVEDSFGQVSIMEELAERRQGLVGGEDHGPLAQVAVVDDAVEDVGSVRCVALVAELVDHQDVRVQIGLEGFVELGTRGGGGEVADELVGRRSGPRSRSGWRGKR